MSADFTLEVCMLEIWCDEDAMMHYNDDNNSYGCAAYAQAFETIEHHAV